MSSDWEAESRELELRCTTDGTITRLDARAESILGPTLGRSLIALAVEGTERKVRGLLLRARLGPAQDWEVALRSGGQPITLTFAGKLLENGEVALLGCMLPLRYSRTLSELNQSLDEVVSLNREISRQRKELAGKNDQLVTAYTQLDESHRGDRSLHAELAEKADTLRRASDVKSRVVANVSHEFRTPLHTILALSRLLLEDRTARLTDEQQKQVRFIRTSAEELSALVNDLLDLSKAESGRGALRIEPFTADDLFASMRGMLRPLVQGNVDLVFEPPPEVRFETDSGKVAQIIRNLVTNALKFTEAGEVRVWLEQAADNVRFYVRDTGIGIAEEHFETIFEEFGQVESPLQRRVRGTGLGLPLSRKLAELLNGTLDVESVVGHGSMFILELPALHPEASELARIEQRPLDALRNPVLVVEDDRKTIFVYERFLALAGFQVVPARHVEHARRLLETLRPAAIVLELAMSRIRDALRKAGVGQQVERADKHAAPANSAAESSRPE